MNKIAILTIGLVFGSQVSNAWFDRSKSGNSDLNKQRRAAKAAGCAPATASEFLELNNVRALIEQGGSMWQDRSTSNAAYFVPAEGESSSIYAGALWLGGVDVNNQLKIAALQFRQGNDFWPGPLTISGDAEVDAATCLEYDKFFEVTRQDINEFNAWYEAGVFDAANGTTTQTDNFPGYTIPEIILNWPAHGDVSKDQDFYLAPFYDRNNDGVYNPNDGDYPWYDINNELECGVDRTVTLYGDHTYWWVFNDKGNVHTETGADPIGMEIKAQAFAFATNDEVNNMTFYNYELINRSTQTLTGTYFGQWVDADLGCSEDDYVGCDVERGLGYAYNADGSDDEGCNGAIPYGDNPPAIGVDFFEGPYKDNDGIDNPGPTADNGFFISYNDAVAGDGIVYKGMGIGYGDGVIDNERFGMRKFLYHNRAPFGISAQQDPNNGVDYYNYLRGIWKDGTQFVYGGSAHISDAAADPSVPCDYMFPGDSDPQGFGTGGIPSANWSEFTNGNPEGDRRFMQSAGPFTLQPGAVNNITVGVVWARQAGGLFASVEAVRLADDKAQALFDNCFKVLDGPDAPDVDIQELNQELILYLSNSTTSNNNGEQYVEVDPFIITPDSLLDQGIQYDNQYRFQGYQIFQLRDDEVGPSDLWDTDKARPVAQVDIKDGVTQLINWEFDESIGVPVPQEMVNGADEGVRHSFKVTTDLFAEGNSQLVNHKKYYFMAIAYAYNNYKTYDITDPLSLDGQQVPYKASRKSPTGAIKVYTGIPHIPTPEAGGTYAQSEFGDGPEITRLEGQGNGALVLDLTETSEDQIVANNFSAYPTYQAGRGPITVEVIDPLNVVNGQFELRFARDTANGLLDSSNWTVSWLNPPSDLEPGIPTVVESDRTIAIQNEQLIPEWGISITITQYKYEQRGSTLFTDLLESSVEYADSSKRWLSGVEDADGFTEQNWIRAGTQEEDDDPNANGAGTYNPADYNDYLGIDDDEVYEGVVNGTWGPYSLCGVQKPFIDHQPIATTYSGTRTMLDLHDLQSVDIVFTSEKSKWTRCPVLEMQDDNGLSQGGAFKQELRQSASVDQNGNDDGSGTIGLGWFPGYAIDVETGERLNMAFGEDSWLAVDNGRDMQFNPTSTMYTALGEPIFGGKHYVYVFKNQDREFGGADRMPIYDEAVWMYDKLTQSSTGQKTKVWRSCIWVGMPMPEEGFDFLETDAKVRIRVAKSYDIYATGDPNTIYLADSATNSINNWDPMYSFSTEGMHTVTNELDTAKVALDLINVVPNPYYAFSAYEENRLDNRVKFTNLPDICTISIYTVNGTLIRSLSKDSPLTSIDWDLKNQDGIPIAGGVYIVHINVPGVGEKIIKWFGALRPPDLDNF